MKKLDEVKKCPECGGEKELRKFGADGYRKAFCQRCGEFLGFVQSTKVND